MVVLMIVTLLYGNFTDHTACGKKDGRNTSGIFEGDTDNLGRVNDTGLVQIFVSIGQSVVAESAFSVQYLVNDDRSISTRIGCYGTNRRLKRFLKYGRTESLVTLEL